MVPGPMACSPSPTMTTTSISRKESPKVSTNAGAGFTRCEQIEKTGKGAD